MLDKEEFVEVGHIRKGYGFSGHARIEIDEAYLEDFNKQDFLFLEIDGYKVPFYIQEKIKHRHLIIKLEHINSSEALQFYNQHLIFLLKKDTTVSLATSSSEVAPSIEGYLLLDTINGEIGTIVRVEQYPQQVIAFVNYNDKEVMIPIHQDLVEALDHKAKTINMSLPEGLLEVQ